MPTRKKLDLSQLAKSIVDQATGAEPKTKLATAKQLAACKAGKTGGKSRMSSLTDAERSALAMKGVAARKKAPAGKAGAEASVKR